MKNSILLLSCIFESTVNIHMHTIMKCITHLCMHTSQTQNLWLWPKRPPSAFSVAETSVAEMSRPKRPRPKCPLPKCPSTVDNDQVAWTHRPFHPTDVCIQHTRAPPRHGSKTYFEIMDSKKRDLCTNLSAIRS